MYKRIIYLRDSSASVPASQKLKELLGFETQIKNCGYPPDSVHALLLQRVGAAYYAAGDVLNAIKFTWRSNNILHLSPGTPLAINRYLLKNYSNLVTFYESLNDSHGQRQAIDSCIAIGKTLPVIEDYYLMALLKKANSLFYAGDYSFSFSYANTGEEASRRYDNAYNRTAFIFSFFNCKLNILLNGKKYDLAEELLLSAFKDTLNGGAKDYLGTIYEHLAEVMIYKEKPAPAVNFFRKALACDRLVGDSLGCMQTTNNFGYQFYFKHLRDYKKALATYRHALTFSNRKPGDELESWERLNVYGNIAWLMMKGGLYDSAFHYFQLAFDQVEPGFNESKIPDSLLTVLLSKGNARYLVEILINKADAFYTRYLKTKDKFDLTEAIKGYKFTDHLLDKMRMNHFEQESKLLWRVKSRVLYEHAIEACYQDNRAADAFYFLEKSRAVLLSDQLYEQNLVAQDDILLEGQLKKDIAGKQAALKNLSSGDSSYMRSLNDLLDSKQKLLQLQQSIKIKNPLYYQHFIDTGFITIADVQHRVLARHNALLELYAGDSAVYAMAIMREKIFFKRINRPAFDSAADLFTNYLSNVALLNRRFIDFTQISNYLYTLVFNGISLPGGRVIISPDGHYFPFEALVTGIENRNPVYFLDKYAVSYTYSGRYLLNQFPAPSSDAPDFLGIAPVNYPKEASLPSLENCDLSLDHVKSYFRNADMQLFGTATKNNFMKDFTRYKIIQLYTHASDGGSQGEPVIYFADSILRLSELIGGHKPATNLIVLSACNTGIGALHIGEGVFSFNRGFASLGIPAAISNLWSADKASAIQLTESFYKYLDKGEPTDIALQHAKLEFLKSASARNKLPYYWAGTILAGKAERIDCKKPLPWTIILIVAGCVVLICVLVYRKRKGTRNFNGVLNTESDNE